MERYQIKVQLLGRSFPMMVTPKEEESILAAVRIVEERLSVYKNKFGINDDSHLLTMCCLDIANEFVRSEKDNQYFRAFFAKKLSSMGELLDSSLNKVKSSG